MLLYSEFAVILGYVHLYTLMMIVPIFNSMTRIDHRYRAAACGASILQVAVDGHSAVETGIASARYSSSPCDGRLCYRRRARGGQVLGRQQIAPTLLSPVPRPLPMR